MHGEEWTWLYVGAWHSHLKGEFTAENLNQMLALLTGLVTAENTQLGYKGNTKPYQKPQSTKPPQSYSLSEVINTQRIDVSALYFE